MKILKIILIVLLFYGCGSDLPDGPDQDSYIPDPTTHGYQRIIHMKPLVSALKVSIGTKYASTIARDYYGAFGATAAHFATQSLPDEAEVWRSLVGGEYVGWLEFDGTSHGKLRGGRNVPGNIGFQYGDEPARGCDSWDCVLDRLDQINTAIHKVRQVGPGHLAIVNFKKSDWMDRAIQTYGNNIDGDILSYDYYTYGDDAYIYLNLFRKYGLQYSKPYWRYMKAFCYKGKGCDITESNVRWQAWAGLTYGYTGHTWFVYNVNNCNYAHDDIEAVLFEGECGNFNKTVMWHFVAALNKKLVEVTDVTKKCVSLGVRAAGEIKNVIEFTSLEFGIIRNVQTDGPVLLGIFKEIYSPRRKHVIVQNPSRDAVGRPQSVHVELDCGNQVSFDLKPGEGRLVSCQ